MSSPRAFKDAAYDLLGQVGKALGSPRRLELLDLLSQGPRPVESLAEAAGQSVANTSQHLQVLKRAGLVQAEREGTTIRYRLAAGVADVVVALRALARARVAELDRIERTFFDDAALEPVDRATLRERLDNGDVVLLDVRPASEYAHGHIAGARSVPIDELERRLGELPADRPIVAYCRGPWCVYAADAVRLLRARGLDARRLEEGVAEWRAAGGPVAEGAP